MKGYNAYNKSVDTCAYICGIICLLIFITANQYIIRSVPPCMFHLITGYYCPGCGGTRAIEYVLSGHFIKSIYYHPLVLYVALPGLLFLFTQTAYRIRRRFFKSSSPDNTPFPVITIRPGYIYIACIIIILQWAIKNLLLLLFHYDLLG